MDLVTSRCSQPAFKPAQRTHRRCYASAAHPKPSSDISVSEPQVQAQAQVQAVPRRTVLLQTAAAAVVSEVILRALHEARMRTNLNPGVHPLAAGVPCTSQAIFCSTRPRFPDTWLPLPSNTLLVSSTRTQPEVCHHQNLKHARVHARVMPSTPGACAVCLPCRFAVLLMRSAYDSLDELDIVAMNKFQKDFWKLRQSEQEVNGILRSRRHAALQMIGRRWLTSCSLWIHV
jgi:hypothetical protein